MLSALCNKIIHLCTVLFAGILLMLNSLQDVQAEQSLADMAKQTQFTNIEKLQIEAMRTGSDPFLRSIALKSMPLHILPADKQQIVIQHFDNLNRIDGLAELFALEMRKIDPSQKGAPEYSYRLSSSLIQKLYIRGLRRLSDQDRITALSLSPKVAAISPARNCVAFMYGTELLDQNQWLADNFRVFSTMSNQSIRDFYAVTIKAITAELHNYPIPKNLTADEMHLVEQVMQGHLLDYDIKHPEEKLLDTLSHYNSYSYEARCRAMITYNDIIINMKGHVGELLRLYMVLIQV